jgi:ferredoxin-NADP reductase
VGYVTRGELAAPSAVSSPPVGLWRALESVLTPHGVDRYLELIHPMLAVHEQRALITDARRITSDSISLTLRPNRAWRGFVAGQYVQLGVTIGAVRHSRCFSPASSQHRADGRVELVVKAHPDGFVTRWLFANARPGLVVALSPAAGMFTLRTPRPDRVVLISGGSGITPVLAMLRTLVDEGHRGQVAFLHYAHSQADVPHLAELRAIARAHGNVQVVLAGTRQVDTQSDVHGRFHERHLPAWHAEADTFVCGPRSLQAAVRAHYGDTARVHTEQFTLAPRRSDDSPNGRIRFGDVVVENSGATLLEQAEAAGLHPDYGCRMGICFTCPKVKRTGCTRDVRNGELHTEPDAPVQLCVSVPVGDVDIEL